MTIEEFISGIEDHKNRAYNKAWKVLFDGLGGETEQVIITPQQVDIAKYIINRKEGMPTAKVAGENGEPIILKLVNYGDNNSAPVSTENIPDTSSKKQGEVQGASVAQEVGEKQDGAESTDLPDANKEGNILLHTADIPPSQTGDMGQLDKGTPAPGNS